MLDDRTCRGGGTFLICSVSKGVILAGTWRLGAAWTICMRSCTSSIPSRLRCILIPTPSQQSNVKSSDEWKVYLYLWALLRRANGMHPLARAQALSFVLMLQACMSFSHKILCMQHSSKLPSILTSRYMGRMAWGNLQWAVIPGGIPGMH